MNQYRPEAIARKIKKLDRCITAKEFSNISQLTKNLGLLKPLFTAIK